MTSRRPLCERDIHLSPNYQAMFAAEASIWNLMRSRSRYNGNTWACIMACKRPAQIQLLRLGKVPDSTKLTPRQKYSLDSLQDSNPRRMKCRVRMGQPATVAVKSVESVEAADRPGECRSLRIAHLPVRMHEYTSPCPRLIGQHTRSHSPVRK
jgi:hypothetical protein